MDVERLVVTLTANAVQYNRVMDEVVQTVVRTASAITNVFAKTGELAVAAFKAPFQMLSGLSVTSLFKGLGGVGQMLRGVEMGLDGMFTILRHSAGFLRYYNQAWTATIQVLGGAKTAVEGIKVMVMGFRTTLVTGMPTGLVTAGLYHFLNGLQTIQSAIQQFPGAGKTIFGVLHGFFTALQGGGNIVAGFGKMLGGLKDAFVSVASGVWSAVKGVGTAVWELGKAFASVGFEVVTGMAKTLTAGLGGLLLVTGLVGAQTLRLAADYEKANIAFGVMTGNAEVGTKLLEDITQLGISSPFRSTELIPIAKELKAFGVETDQIIPTLKALGNVSAGTDTPLSRIALAFGQVRVAGRLTGDELRQFVNANVRLIEYLAQVMNVPETSIRNMVEAGRVGFNHVQMAFNAMSAEGGAYAGLMEKLNNTVGGQWSSFVERIELAMRNVGLAFFKGFGVKDLLKEMSEGLTGVGGSVDRLVPYFQKLRDIFDVLAAAGKAIGSSVANSIDRMVEGITGSGINWNDAKEGVTNFVRALIIGLGNAIDMMMKFAKSMVRDVLMPTADFMRNAGIIGEKSVYGSIRDNGYNKAVAGFASTGVSMIEQVAPEWTAERKEKVFGIAKEWQNPFKPVLDGLNKMSSSANTGAEALADFNRQMELLSTTADHGEQEFWKMKLEEEKDLRNSLWGAWFSPIASATNTGTEGLLRVVQALPGEVTKLVEKVRKDIETEGTTDYDKFATNIDRLFKAANYPMPLKEGVIGPGLPTINEQELAFGVASQFEEFSKGLSKSMTTMPPAARFGSTEAAETINRSMVDQKSTMEEVRMAIVLGNQMAAERKKRLDEILAAVRANKGGIVVAKPPGNGK